MEEVPDNRRPVWRSAPRLFVLLLLPFVLSHCEPWDHRGYQKGTISFAVPVNLCEHDKTWTLEFALPEGDWYFASMFVYCPDGPLPESYDIIKLQYDLDFVDGSDESGTTGLDLSSGYVAPRVKRQISPGDEESIAAWRDSYAIWPWHAMVAEKPRDVFPTPLGIGIARDSTSIGTLTITVDNPESVPKEYCEAQLRIDTYLGH